MFLRKIIRTMSISERSFHKVHLDAHCRADIAWWTMFIQSWNGISWFHPSRVQSSMFSNALGSWGCGALQQQHTDGSLHWFQLKWPQQGWHEKSIAIKELIPMVISTAIWGRRWHNHVVTFTLDNMAVVTHLQKAQPRTPTWPISVVFSSLRLTSCFSTGPPI